MDLTLHPSRFPTTLEKWYVDVLLADGTVLIVYLGAIGVLGFRVARVMVDLFRPGAPVVRASAKARAVVGAEGGLQFGPVIIDGDVLRLATPSLSGELIFRPRFGACELASPFLRQGARSLTWTIEVPDADVEGALRWPGGHLDVRGRGYRDRVYFDLASPRLPFRTLTWGRAVSASHAATWVAATTSADRIVRAWKDGQGLDVAAVERDAPPACVDVGEGRVLVDADVAGLPGLRLGPLSGLLGRLTGGAHETKWQAACAIDGERGVAVHERVTWRAGAPRTMRHAQADQLPITPGVRSADPTPESPRPGPRR
jgi:hypothetical protein